MNPYSIHNKDAVEFLNSLEKGSADLVFTDLPFGTTRHKHDTPLSQQDIDGFIGASKRVLTADGGIFVFCQHSYLEPIKRSLGKSGYKTVRFGTWIKTTSNTSPTPYPANSVEFWVFSTKVKTGKRRLLPVYVSRGNQPKLGHEKHSHHRKPISLCRTIIRNHTDAGDVVIDPYAGCGSAGVSALLESRQTVINDINPDRLPVMKANLERWKEYAGFKPLEDFCNKNSQQESIKKSQRKRLKPKEETNSKTNKKERKRQLFSASKRDKVAKIIFTHNFKQPYEPAEFVDAIRSAVALPTLDEAAVYKLGWEVIRSVRVKYPDTELTLPKETKSQRVLRIFEEFSASGSAGVISYSHNQKLKIKPAEKPKRRQKSKPKPRASHPERRGVRDGLTEDQSLSIIIKKAKVRSGELPDKRKGDE